MNKRQFDLGVPPDTSNLSVRQARRVKSQWERERMKAKERELDPESFAASAGDATRLIQMMTSREWWFDANDVAGALEQESNNHLLHPSAKSRIAELGGLHTVKVGAYESSTGGVARYYSKVAVAMIAMTSHKPVARAFQAWAAHVVAHAGEHAHFEGFWNAELRCVAGDVEGRDIWGERLAEANAKLASDD